MAPKQTLKPRKSPRQARARQTVEAILEAAAQVFGAEGYTRTTTDRIAQRAGVSVGSLYQYFPNKDAIVVALAEQHVAASVGRIEAWIDAAGGAQELRGMELDVLLNALIRETLAQHRQHPRLHRLLFVEAPVPAEQHARLEALEHQLVQRVADLLRAHPDVKVNQPLLAAWMLVHAVHALIHDFVVHPPAPSVTEQDFVNGLTGMLAAYARGNARG